MEKIHVDDQDEGRNLIKQILNTYEFQQLKKENIGFFYKAQDDLCRISKSGRDIEYLKRCLKTTGEAIADLLPQSSGFRLTQMIITVKNEKASL